MYWQKSASSAKSDEVEVSSPVKGVPRLKKFTNITKLCIKHESGRFFTRKLISFQKLGQLI
jgi:hypothetical protein